MIVRTRHGQVEIESRMAAFGTAPIPGPWSGMASSSGVIVTTETAVGLPAVGRAIRLIGGMIGAATICVFEGDRGDKREVSNSSQYALLQNPYPGHPAFDWRYDIAVSLEATENAFVRKIKSNRGQVVAMQVIPPALVNAMIGSDGEKYYRISTAQGWKELPASEILHIRGQTVEGGPFGVSRILQHRNPLGAMLAAQRFEGAFYRNNARPDFVMEFPAGVSAEQGREWKAVWDSQHAGVDEAGQSRAIGGGAKITPIPVSMNDAQFIQGKEMGVSDIARIMDVEEVLLGSTMETQDDQAMDRFLAFQLPPRLARIVSALKADTDIFPVGSPLYPEFVSNPLMFASPITRANVQHQEIQAGTLLPDEARAENGRPPLPDGVGMIPQVTPVGGAPNPVAPPAARASDLEVANDLRREIIVERRRLKMVGAKNV